MKYFCIVLMLLATLTACHTNTPNKKEKLDDDEVVRDLSAIKERGKLIVSTDYNSTDYFIYRGTPMGYQLDLLNAFSKSQGIKLELVVNNDINQNIKDLLDGDIDLIAKNLTVTSKRNKQILFTEPHSYTHQVLVQRKITTDKKQKNNRHADFIKDQLELAGKTIYVPKGSAFQTRLQHLSDEIGDSINIIDIPHYESEQLINLVSKKEIDYTVADANVAKVNGNYYSNIDISVPVGFTQKLAWAVRKSSPDLLYVLNNWLVRFKKTRKYYYIYQKYFLNTRSKHFTNNNFNTVKGGAFSPFDDIIKKEAKGFDWDWRLIASLIYQESRFDPNIKSWSGAQGLMQLMPATAEQFHVKNVYSPEQNIHGGIALIKWLDNRMSYRIQNHDERVKFVLAAYNVGIGHVLDAIRLAKKYGKNPNVWTGNVDFFLLNKSLPKYFKDPVVQFGYCRGEEPYKYVKAIFERYEHYKNLVK